MTNRLTWPKTLPAQDHVVLRPFVDGDVDAVVVLSSDPYIPTVTSLVADADHANARKWIARSHSALETGSGYSYAIVDRDTDRALGQIGLWLSQLDEGRASAGYLTIPSERGRGIATAALIAITRFAWTIEGLDRVELHIEPWNVGSIRTAEKAGYSREGLLRSYQRIGNERRDMYLYSSIRDAK